MCARSSVCIFPRAKLLSKARPFAAATANGLLLSPQLSNVGTSDLSSSDETSHGGGGEGGGGGGGHLMRLSPLSHHQDAVAVTARDAPRDLSTSTPSITNSASTSFSSNNTNSSVTPSKAEDQHHGHHHASSTTTFEDHIVIKEFVPSNLAAAAVSYKGVSAAVSTTLKSATTSASLVKSVGDLSLTKTSVATPLTKTLSVSTTASPPQALVPRGSPPPPMSHALLSVTATPSPASAAVQRADRTLALDTTSQKDIKAIENGKMRNDSEEVSS